MDTYWAMDTVASPRSLIARLFTKRLALALGIVFSMGFFLQLHGHTPLFSFADERPSALQIARSAVIAEVFEHTWNGYSKHYFGRDTLHPRQQHVRG